MLEYFVSEKCDSKGLLSDRALPGIIPARKV